jgi:MFS family permease
MCCVRCATRWDWLFTATFFVMLAVVPIYGALVARLPRQRFIPLVYHFFVANIILFWVLLTQGIALHVTAPAFFIWISVFNLFAVSVFWSFMADLYDSEQGKRLFGFIAAGGSAGALLGPVIAVSLAETIGRAHLLLIAALLLECAVFCAMQLEAAAAAFKAERGADAVTAAAKPEAVSNGLGGSWIAGVVMIARSPYLAGIALWVALLSLAGTFLYFQQANIVAALTDDPNKRTAIFARIDLAVSLLTIVVQFFATGKLIKRFGCGIPAVRVRARFYRVVGHADAVGGHCVSGSAARSQLCDFQSCARSVVHRGGSRRKIQGKIRDRQRGVSRRRRAFRLAVFGAARRGHGTRRDFAGHSTGHRRVAGAGTGLGTHAGKARWRGSNTKYRMTLSICFYTLFY